MLSLDIFCATPILDAADNPFLIKEKSSLSTTVKSMKFRQNMRLIATDIKDKTFLFISKKKINLILNKRGLQWCKNVV